jgi:WD40 repeat protein
MGKFRLVLFIFIWLPIAVYSQEIIQYKSNNLELVYIGKRYSYMIPHMVGSFENALGFHQNLWDYNHKKTHVFLNDFSDFGHGGATALPLNQVFLGIEPYSFAFSIIPSSERFQWLFNHELTHISMADKANRNDLFWRKMFFGKVLRNEHYPVSALWSYLTVPRWYAPRWFHEGIACYLETWMSGGLGRAMGPYDEMYFRSIVADRQPIYSMIGLETEGTTIDFQVGANAYLYGTRFVNYISMQYGVDKLKQFFMRTDDSKAFFGSQFKKVYGQNIKTVWNEWADWEYSFQQQNIAQVSQFPLTAFRPITNKELGSVSKYGYNAQTGKMYAAINYPGIISQVAEIDIRNGKIRKLATLDSPSLYYSTHLAYDPDNERVFITEQNHNYRSLVQIDVKTGAKKTLIRYSRTGELAYNRADQTLWGVQHDNGYARLVKIPPPYDKVVPMYSADFGKSLFDVAVSNNGKMVTASLTGIRGEMSLILFNIDELETGNKQFRTVYELEDNTLTQFKFSPNDEYLIGTSYYSGVSNIWRIPVDGSKFELLSNTETGMFMPVQFGSDSLIALKFQRDGMLPVTLGINVIDDANAIEYMGNLVTEKNHEVKEWSLPAPPRIHPDTIRGRESQYHVLRKMQLMNAYPDVSGFKNTVAAGYRFHISDPLSLSNINLFLGTSPWSDYDSKQKIHAQLDWKYWNWRLLASYNKTDFYDLFGPTKRSRAGYSVGLNYTQNYTMRKPLVFSYSAGLYTYGDLEVLPQYQNIESPIKNFQAASLSASVEKLRKTLGGVDDETGFKWELDGTGIYAGGDFYPTIQSNQSIGMLVPVMRNTSFWIRNSIGQSFGNSESAMSHFYFGGFRNNYVDWQASEQYRKTMAFPGAQIDEIKAYNYIKTMGELNLRPIRLRNVGTGWLYPTYIKSSIFSTHIITNLNKAELTRNIFNFGGQIDIQLVLFSYLKTTWSVGYAVMTEQKKDTKGQLMLSVKLLGN